MQHQLPGHETPYRKIYRSLQLVRETFHREGRISDANAKLDETVKFLLVHFGRLKGFVSSTDYRALSRRDTFSVSLLNRVMAQLLSRPLFRRRGLGPIFGRNPSTIFRSGDDTVAFELFAAAGQAFDAQVTGTKDLDILNEAFGHHVRDNFRNDIEDAQYMTPPEVVNFMVDLGMKVAVTGRRGRLDDFMLADPSCGVGSFLTRWRAVYSRRVGAARATRLKCVGQDKVERMVRLSAVNFVLSGGENDDVFLGNAIEDGSPIGRFDSGVDLILTNPPFGARFSVEKLRRTSSESTPFFAKTTKTFIESEFLFLERYLTLLRPGGTCLVVVPDRVISAKGTAALARQYLARNADIVGVVELPPVTFAQAGTRTKTAILGFRKRVKPKKSYYVFFSEATDIGFQVSKRKGVAIKNQSGTNQLPEIMRMFREGRGVTQELSASGAAWGWREVAPSVTVAWTPRTLLFDHDSLQHRVRGRLARLGDLVEPPQQRRPLAYTEKHYFVSVLHVIGRCILDVAAIKSYRPVTPGFAIEPGEVLVSRINPRIPRVVVVPDLGRQLLCSTEYEILRPTSGVSPYGLGFMLLDPVVQQQIAAMTAGTSASHNRIGPGRVYDVLVPDLRHVAVETAKGLKKYEASCRKATELLIEMDDMRHVIKL